MTSYPCNKYEQITPSYRLSVNENMPNKFFYGNSEYIKRISKFLGEIYSENCQLYESFYRFQFTFMYLEKSIFCANQPAQ